jgi:hypothetical protein
MEEKRTWETISTNNQKLNQEHFDYLETLIVIQDRIDEVRKRDKPPQRNWEAVADYINRAEFNKYKEILSRTVNKVFLEGQCEEIEMMCPLAKEMVSLDLSYNLKTKKLPNDNENEDQYTGFQTVWKVPELNIYVFSGKGIGISFFGVDERKDQLVFLNTVHPNYNEEYFQVKFAWYDKGTNLLNVLYKSNVFNMTLDSYVLDYSTNQIQLRRTQVKYMDAYDVRVCYGKDTTNQIYPILLAADIYLDYSTDVVITNLLSLIIDNEFEMVTTKEGAHQPYIFEFTQKVLDALSEREIIWQEILSLNFKTADSTLKVLKRVPVRVELPIQYHKTSLHKFSLFCEYLLPPTDTPEDKKQIDFMLTHWYRIKFPLPSALSAKNMLTRLKNRDNVQTIYLRK